MPQRNSLRIIIADDEGVIRMGLKMMVQTIGHKVVATVRTGEEAIEKVEILTPDLLLLDIKMPGLDGLTAAKILADKAPLPIIMLTAYSQRELVEEAVNAMVMGYLVKPVDESNLAPAIDLAINRFQNLRDTADEVSQLKKSLAARELVAKAKRLLTERGYSETEAYHQIQRAARRRQISLGDMAERVIARQGEL